MEYINAVEDVSLTNYSVMHINLLSFAVGNVYQARVISCYITMQSAYITRKRIVIFFGVTTGFIFIVDIKMSSLGFSYRL